MWVRLDDRGDMKCLMLLCHIQAIRVLGLLGALDPYKHKVNIGMIDQSRDASAVSLSESKSSQDSGRPGIPSYQSQFGECLFKALNDGESLLSYISFEVKVSASHCGFIIIFLYQGLSYVPGKWEFLFLNYCNAERNQTCKYIMLI